MADQTPIYDELSIRIQPGSGDGYRTVVCAPDGATASGAFVLPFNETEVDNFVLRVGRQRLTARSYRSAQMEEAKRFGSQLFEALMTDAVRDVFRSARAVADKAQKGLRLTLCLTEAPELMDIPWEFLYQQPRFLAQSIYSPVVRSLDLTEVPAPYPLNLPLNVVGMVSAPRGFDNLDVDREKGKLIDALAPLCAQGMVTIEWLENGTLQQLDDAISRHGEINVFHYIGHGAYDPRAQGGILVLEDNSGNPHEVTGEELGLLLQDERGLRLAVLNSCEGARSSHLDPFSGVASSLVQYGVPAVIGMQFEITDEAAIAFASRLYTSLAQGFPVDAAVAQSRRSIFAAGNDIEFGTPVLFLRGMDAQLFEVIDRPSPEEPLPEPELEPLPASLVSDDWSSVAPVATEELPPARDYHPWLPRPWQDGLRNLKADLRHPHRLSNRRLLVGSLLLLVLGVVITSVYGHQSATGKNENIFGSLVTGIGSLGLTIVFFKFVLERAWGRFNRFRDWWTGSG